MLSADQLRQIMPSISSDKLDMYLPFLNSTMDKFEIDTPLRAAAFVAQLAHESGEFKFMQEIWGPTAQQLKYEPPSTVATNLGNTEPGDGARFKGRGPIQITGRANYQRYGDMLGVDLVENPDLAATPQIAFALAGLFWKTNGLNELADIQDFIKITKRINGGTNGLPSRQKYYERAKAVLGTRGPARGISRGAAPEAIATPAVELSAVAAAETNILPRGWETISDALSTAETAPVTKKKPAKKKATKPAGKKTVKAAPQKPAKKAVKKAAPKKAAKTAKKAAKKTATKATKKSVKAAPKKAAPKKAAPKKAAPVKKAPVKAAKKASKKVAPKAAKKPASKKTR